MYQKRNTLNDAAIGSLYGLGIGALAGRPGLGLGIGAASGAVFGQQLGSSGLGLPLFQGGVDESTHHIEYVPIVVPNAVTQQPSIEGGGKRKRRMRGGAATSKCRMRNISPARPFFYGGAKKSKRRAVRKSRKSRR